MRRAYDVVGTKVIYLQTGQIVGKVADLLFNSAGCLQGLVLERKYWFVKAPFIPISQISFIGEDLVTIHSLPEFTVESIKENWIYLHDGQPKLKGTPLITPTGKQLGLLEDVYFQEELGTILEYEVTAGFFADLVEGRRRLKKPTHLLLGKDVFVIDEEEYTERIQ